MKRGHIAALALALPLALAGCGGNDDGKTTSASSPPAPTAAATAPSTPQPGQGTETSPLPPAQSKAVKAFNDCMQKQGVQMPTPNPTRTPAPDELQKIRTALQTCVKSMSAPPTPH
ncbi:hypothetical protein ACIBI3_10170 [Actinomadura luteofluorescens]|uniref:hypothetical protein n=1 Tax=Actinomadura luteofluorescens TaxID=46163 RepID=UPI0034845828